MGGPNGSPLSDWGATVYAAKARILFLRRARAEPLGYLPRQRRNKRVRDRRRRADEHHHGVRWGNPRLFLFFVPGKLMAALAYRDDKILARNLLSRPFFCLTPAEPFFRPDRSPTAPSCRVAVKDGRAFRGHPKGLSLTAASTMARWRSRSGRRPCVAAEHVSSPRRSSRLPASRSRSLYRSPGTPIGKPINYLDFANIKLPAPA